MKYTTMPAVADAPRQVTVKTCGGIVANIYIDDVLICWFTEDGCLELNNEGRAMAAIGLQTHVEYGELAARIKVIR